MSIEMSQFYQVFFDEAEELLAEKEKLLLAIDVAAPDVEELNAIFRVAHSIKGGAATFGFSDMTEVTHMLESLLDRIRKGEMALTADHVDAFLAAKDVLKMQMNGHRHGEGTDRGAAEEVCQRLARLSHGAPAAPAAAPAPVAAAETAATAEAPAGAARFRIELPETPQRDVEALAAELGLMGELEQSRTADGHALFTLSTDVGEDAIVAVCAFVLDPDALKITRAEGGAAPAAAAPPEAAAPAETGAGAVRFRIELPETSQRDVEALAAELGLMGELDQSRTADGHALFTLSTDVGEDAIVAVCAFVLDPDALKITRADVAEPPVPADEGASASEEPGYGIFEPPNFDPPARAAAAEQQSAAAPAEGESPNRRASDQAPGETKNLGRRASDREAASQESSSIRVGIEKVDQLINLVGELVITQAMIEQRIGALDPLVHERLLNSAGQLARNTRDLQEAVMSIRMMPMEYVFSRFPRMVRDLAGKLGKKVEFVTRGAATELDKGLIERIVDPLTHLVRNSVDHGVEMPEVRRAAGKSETGRLILSAAHQGGNIVIEVSDDGGGLNRGKILAKALQNGLPVSDALSDAEVWQLIFAPGFSTAEVVTDVSGRGVGMDVVKRNITAMGGTVDIRSAPGYGTTITISLPLTLAILDGMSVRVGEETYILPLGYVIESLQPAPADVKEMAGQGRVVKVREEYLPLIPLHRIFAIEPRFTDPTQGIVVILEADGRKAALLVDALGGQQQVVVKNLESNFRKVAGISGATILGDGGVSLILDVSALLRSSRQLDIESVFS